VTSERTVAGRASGDVSASAVPAGAKAAERFLHPWPRLRSAQPTRVGSVLDRATSRPVQVRLLAPKRRPARRRSVVLRQTGRKTERRWCRRPLERSLRPPACLAIRSRCRARSLPCVSSPGRIEGLTHDSRWGSRESRRLERAFVARASFYQGRRHLPAPAFAKTP
jgi:hypothetical protein